ncbi:Hypothetical protein R9X50_00515300 [Acrodontium crateriforme]|uniref:DUF1746 domain-containing protein n=1 Tax=Acrodontium crateriforme TaxID=150365 RepID=A0AAQ3M938_9PEZI|nr:Hypothetical protein R9X50_00515300 [Acrodontium crateriforme]
MNNDDPSSSIAGHNPAGPSSSTSDPNSMHSLIGRLDAILADRRKKNRQVFAKKRGELLGDLLWNLDVLVYAELSTVYYMDCSFVRFVLRAMVQFFFLTPKPAYFPETPAKRPYIGAILGTNILCIILHSINAAPSASEATRGYLHGSIAMDFIGQKGPSSKFHLLVLDLMIVVLQIVCLSAHLIHRKLKDGLAQNSTAGARVLGPSQDVDHEERGLLRANSDTPEAIELHALNPSGAAMNRQSTTHNATHNATSPHNDEDDMDENYLPRRTDDQISDAFNSGKIVLANLNPIQTIKDQYLAFQITSLQESRESNRRMRENLVGQLLRSRPSAGRVLGE